MRKMIDNEQEGEKKNMGGFVVICVTRAHDETVLSTNRPKRCLLRII